MLNFTDKNSINSIRFVTQNCRVTVRFQFCRTYLLSHPFSSALVASFSHTWLIVVFIVVYVYELLCFNRVNKVN